MHTPLIIQQFVNSEPPVCGDCGIVFDVLIGVKVYDRIPILIAHATQCRPGISLNLEEATEKANYLTTELEKFRQQLTPTAIEDDRSDVGTYLEGNEKAGQKRKNVTDGEERRLLLENDPWTKSVGKVEVTCTACNQRIQLDGRNGCAYYGYNWTKHKAGCCKIPLDVREAVKAEKVERARVKKISRPMKKSRLQRYGSPSSSHSGHGLSKDANSSSISAPAPSLRSSAHDQTEHDISPGGIQRGEIPLKRRKVEGFEGPRKTAPTHTSPCATQSGIATRSRLIAPSGTGSRYFDTVLCSTREMPSPYISDSFRSETSASVVKPRYFYPDSPTSIPRLRKATFD